MFLANGRVGVFDLATGGLDEQVLSDESFSKTGSIGVARGLLDEHGDALVLGAGPLTGSLVPAACAGLVMSGAGAMPLLGFAGVELKLSGFDFVVVKGEAPGPGYLWIRDGMAEFVPAPDLGPMDSWKRTDGIRKDQGDRRIQVLSAGPWSSAGRKASCAVVNHWLGEDEVFTGVEMGRRNLLAVAFRGMGELEVSDPEEHFSACLSLRSEHISKLGAPKGLESYWSGAGEDRFLSLVHRHVGCFGCPHPCRSFLKVNEDPQEMRMADGDPGYLHFDIPSLDVAMSSGFSPRDATTAFMECAKAAADPCSVIGSGAADVDGVRKALTSGDPEPVDRSSMHGSFRSCEVFDEAVALGLCPRYWAKVGLDKRALSACAEPALGRPLL